MGRVLQAVALTMAALLLREVQSRQITSTVANENEARRSLTEGLGGIISTLVDPLKVESSGGCILNMDSRSMASRSEQEAPWTYMEERGPKLPFWVATKFINKHYAKKHGYKYIFKSPSAFMEPGEEPRADSWYKIKFMKEQLQCCCRWAFFIDSDAYFRMSDHSLSIEGWLQKLNETSYFDELESKGVNLHHQTWYPEHPLRLLEAHDSTSKLIALIPRNGDNLEGWCGSEAYFFPDPPDDCPEFINAGIVLLRNSTLTMEFLDEWYADPSPTFLRNHPWEQRRLNLISAKYRPHLALVPYMEATGPEGRQIRHVWGSVPSARRHRLVREAVLGVAAAMAAEDDG